MQYPSQTVVVMAIFAGAVEIGKLLYYGQTGRTGSPEKRSL